ncbi:MAG: DUF6920 family protein [Spirochaetota bacterium]
MAIGIIVAALIVAVAAIVAYGNVRWQRATDRLQEQLAEADGDARTAPDPLAIDDVPEPVHRYFERVLPDDPAIIQSMRVKQRGHFNMGREDDQWKPFRATQQVNPQHPGFLWDARIHMMPILSVHVHDAYVRGEGLLHGALFGLATVTEMRGTPEAAEGELLRYLAEAPWYPTALLPSQGVTWHAVDARSARVGVSDGATSVSLLVRFGEDGLIESVYADERGREVDGAVVPTPWEGRWWAYERRDGMLVPTEGEVAWLLPERRKPYWRGRIEEISYSFSP